MLFGNKEMFVTILAKAHTAPMTALISYLENIA